MSNQTDLEPATVQMAKLLVGVRDEQLSARTPCPDYTLGDLVEHVGGLARRFTAAALKDLGETTNAAPDPDASGLPADWRTDYPHRLDELATAWRHPEAWTGMTEAGGVNLLGDVAGLFALNELVVHGWDIARASGQDFHVDDTVLQACYDFAEVTAGTIPNGPFGDPVEVPESAPKLDRLVGLRGRDPNWTP